MVKLDVFNPRSERAVSVLELPPASRPMRDEWRAMSPELRDAIRTGIATLPWERPTPPSRGEGE